MKKSLLIISFLISALALPVAAQHTFVKNSPRFSAPAKADEAKTMAMSHVVASYYTAASEATGNCDNYSCSVDALLARLVHLRQVHPLKGNLFVSKMWQFV